jgi:hypothetical protein
MNTLTLWDDERNMMTLILMVDTPLSLVVERLQELMQ